jgi:hypothetical protein
MRYYKDRQAWLVQPDFETEQVSPYPMPEDGLASIAKAAK